jgi:hypothetical protein
VSNTVIAQLRNMKRPMEFVVVPLSDGRILVQSERGVGAFDFRTGKGKFMAIGDSITALINALPYDFPPEFVEECLRVCPSDGGATEIAPGLFAPNTFEVNKGGLI